jgi:predicted esterase
VGRSTSRRNRGAASAGEILTAPHAGQGVVHYGRPLGDGRAVVIMVHGRGAGPQGIIGIAPELRVSDATFLAPAAEGGTWYPQSFMADLARNEPGVSSGLDVLRTLVARVETAGVRRSRIVLAGFSQGACLVSEFAVRHASRFGGILVFSGGAIGPVGTTWNVGGDFDDTPVFLGCSDTDAHVPESRVRETADVFASHGANVTLRIYPGMGHLVNDDEIGSAQQILDGVSG